MLRRGLCWLLCAAAAAMSWLLCAAAFYRYVSMQTLRLQNWRCPQADACKWSTLRIPGDSLCLSAHTGACAPRSHEPSVSTHSSIRSIDIDGPTRPPGTPGPSAHTIQPHKNTKRQNNTTYSGFGGALAYGYGFRIGSAPLGIVAVFGAQNSFCHLGVP